MPDDEERDGEGEDLFEDLDKFFAPIQDVDWPESSEGKIPERAAGAERRDEPSRGDPDRPESESAGTVDEEAVSAEPGVGEPPVGEDPFATQESPPEADVEGEQG